MPPRHNRQGRGVLFFALGVGATCFFSSLFILLLAGIFSGVMPLDLDVGPIVSNFKKPMSWWEIGALLVSFALSALAVEFVVRSCKKQISRGRLHS